MIFLLSILQNEDRRNIKFEYNWFISVRGMNFLINFNMQILKCFMRIRFRSKSFKNFLDVSGHV